MASFLVEAYTPEPASLEEIERSVSRAADDHCTAGPAVRYLRTIYVAEDEICFHIFEAGSVDAVRLATERAEIEAQRIVEAIEIPGNGR